MEYLEDLIDSLILIQDELDEEYDEPIVPVFFKINNKRYQAVDIIKGDCVAVVELEEIESEDDF